MFYNDIGHVSVQHLPSTFRSSCLNIPVASFVFDALNFEDDLGGQGLFPLPDILSLGHDPPDGVLSIVSKLCLEFVIVADSNLETKKIKLSFSKIE